MKTQPGFDAIYETLIRKMRSIAPMESKATMKWRVIEQVRKDCIEHGESPRQLREILQFTEKRFEGMWEKIEGTKN